MRKYISKIGKKTLTIAFSMVVLAGAVYTTGISANAAEHVYDADKVLYESNYDGATRPADSWEGGHFSYSGDLYPAADPDDDANTVLMYTQCRSGLGLALLGHDYKNSEPTERVTVQAGVAYKVDFKLYVKGEVNLGSDLEVGLAVGAESHPQDEGITNGTGKINETNYSAYLEPIVKLVSFREYSTLEEGWKDYTGYIIIPEDADVSIKNALYIYFRGAGNSAYAYVDDVKVTALAGVTVDYVVDGKAVSVYYADGIIPSELPEGVAAEDEEGNSLKLYTDEAYKTLFSAENYERTGKYEKVTLYGTYKDVKVDTDIKADTDKKDDTVVSSSIFSNPVFWVVIALVVIAAAVVVILIVKGKKKQA